jgi:hypothetical protein
MISLHDSLVVLLWYAAFSFGAIISARQPGPAAVDAPTSLRLRLSLLAGFLLPWAMEGTIVRMTYSVAAFQYAARVLQIRGDHKHFHSASTPYLCAFVFLYHDLRKAKPRSRVATAKDLLHSLILSGAVVGSCVALYGFLAVPDVLARHPPAYFALLAAAAIHFFTSIMIVDVFFRSFLLAAGQDAPSTMDSPWAAQSVGEFWRRWNSSIQEILAFVVYAPLRRKGLRSAALAVTFLASGILHVYPLAVLGVGVSDLVSMLLFFVMQIVLIALERRLRLTGRLWALGSVFALTPLFVAPLLRATLLKEA